MVSYEGAGQRLCSPPSHTWRGKACRDATFFPAIFLCPIPSSAQLHPPFPPAAPCTIQATWHSLPQGRVGGLFIPAAARVGPGSRVETGILCLL